MAERQRGLKKAAVYRSVSFKKLESWSANRSRADQQHKSKDLETCGVALPPPPSTTEHSNTERLQPWATRNVSVSRKVSKISAATATGLPTADLKRGSSTPHSLSPSIRQLTEKFSSSRSVGTHRSSPGGGPEVAESTTLPRTSNTRTNWSSSWKSFEDCSGGYLQNIDGDTAESPTETKGKKGPQVILSVSLGRFFGEETLKIELN